MDLFSVCVFSVFFFFFKQKTAYEMRISDWSSDVCSSDLLETAAERPEQFERDLRRIDFHDVARARHGERREGGLAEEMRGDAFVALGISRRPIVEPHPRVVQRDKILAIARQMLVAARAGTAARKADDDRVAHAQPFDAFADRLDHPGAFMAEEARPETA